MTALDERPVARPAPAASAPWPGRRAVLRLARRDALRHRARSALVVAMVALPVVGLAAVDVVARTAQVSGSAVGAPDLPPGVDAQVRWQDGGPVQQSPDASVLSYLGPGTPVPVPSDTQVRAATGAAQVLSAREGGGRLVLSDGRSRYAQLVQADLGSPLAPAVVGTVAEGRAPRSPGEVALSPGALQATGAQVGGTVRLTDAPRDLAVVGTVLRPGGQDGPDDLRLVGPDLLPPADGGERTWWLETPEPLLWPDVLRLNEQGFTVVSRAVLDDPPPDEEVPLLAQPQQDQQDLDAAAFVVLAAGMGLLEVVLLAGPAFAVGARRSRRMLALLAATGGDRRQVRDVVLAQGLVLGLVGATVGLVLGVALGAASLPLVEQYSDTDLPGPVLEPLELLAIAAVGLVTAVLAALLPARGVARQDVALALAGRREPVRVQARVPVLGVVLAGTGFAVVLVGVERRSALTILLGAALGQVGLVLCTPTVVRLLGRAGHVLPLTPRLAVRDAARNVGRTAPAVAAVMAAVAGTVASSIFVASLSERDERMYVPQLPPGQVLVGVSGGITDADLSEVEQAVREAVPVRELAVLRTVDAACLTSGCTEVLTVVPADGGCPDDGPSSGDLDPGCTLPLDSGAYGAAVDDGTALPLLLGRDDPAAVEGLRGERAVVLDEGLLQGGEVELRLTGGGREETVRVPAVAAQPVDGTWSLPAAVVLPPAVAERLGLAYSVRELRVVPERPVTEAQEERLVATAGADLGFVHVERGYEDAYAAGLLALVAGAALVTVGAVATSTALAMTDARPDLATMAAVGASRSVRRRMAVVTALVLAGLGTTLGAVAGAVPGVAAIRALQQDGAPEVADGGWPLVVPWTSLLLIAAAAPLVAGLLVALFTRSRLPVVHRRDA